MLGLLAVGCAVPVVVPVFLIRPFVRQTPEGVAVAYAMREWAPALSAAGLLLGLVTMVLLWPRLRWIGRVPAALAVILLAAAAWGARVNIYEKMFNPVDRPAFASAAEASHVKDDDLVMGIHLNGSARAYPVRALAYHHLVNDEIEGVPVVGTY